jgi:hypothetical protein
MTAMTTTDAPRLSRRDWGVIICGALVLVASFLPWESATSSVGYNGSAPAYSRPRTPAWRSG